MKLLVFEFFSGGGFVEGEISGLIGEAYAMLRYIVEDFREAGFEVYTTLDHRIAQLVPPLRAHQVKVVSSWDLDLFRELLGEFDAVFLIAPETDNILYSLASEVVKAGAKLLGPLPSAIELTTDKSKLLGVAKELGLKVPRHSLSKTSSSAASVEKIVQGIGYPVVFKVLDGAGSEGLSLVSEGNEIPQAIEKIRRVSNRDLFLVEEFVPGVDASVSLISNGEKAFPLSLNFQSVKIRSPNEESKYEGGYVPLRHRLKEQAFEDTKTLVENINGLQGYVGVDVKLSDDEVTILEVNPRLTTSYLGLRRVLRQNLTSMINEAIVNKTLPSKISIEGCAYFKKIYLPDLRIDEGRFRKIAQRKGVAAPPFPMGDKIHAILVTHSKNEKLAMLNMEKMKKDLIEELTGKKIKTVIEQQELEKFPNG